MYSTKSNLLAIVLLSLVVVGFGCGEKSNQPFGPRALTFEERLTEAKGGDAEAQYKVARIYHYGSGTIFKDREEAVTWYRKAAEQGHMLAQFDLARTYHSLPTPDLTLRSSMCGDVSAADSLDRVEAAKWFGKAAEQGHAPSQVELAACYEFGWGVPRDLVPAYVWSLIALKGARRGNVPVVGTYSPERLVFRLLRLSPEMTPEQHEAARPLFFTLEHQVHSRVHPSRSTHEELRKMIASKMIDAFPNRPER